MTVWPDYKNEYDLEIYPVWSEMIKIVLDL